MTAFILLIITIIICVIVAIILILRRSNQDSKHSELTDSSSEKPNIVKEKQPPVCLSCKKFNNEACPYGINALNIGSAIGCTTYFQPMGPTLIGMMVTGDSNETAIKIEDKATDINQIVLDSHGIATIRCPNCNRLSLWKNIKDSTLECLNKNCAGIFKVRPDGRVFQIGTNIPFTSFQRYPSIRCPHCGSMEIIPVYANRFQCKECGRVFT